MCDEKRSELKDRVKGQLRELEASIERHILQGECSAYQTVAVAMRALLTDRNSLRGWICSEHAGGYANIMEYLYDGNIHLQSTLVTQEKSKFPLPTMFLTNHALFGCAAKTDAMMPLNDWLDQAVSFELAARDVIRNIADKDMAHILPEDKFRNTLVIRKMSDGREINPWPQFIVGAGIRLLYARCHNGRKYVRIYPDALRSVQRQVDADLRIRRRNEPERAIRVEDSPAHPIDPFTDGITMVFGNSEGRDISDLGKKRAN